MSPPLAAMYLLAAVKLSKMWFNKEKLEQMSIADLKAIRDYCLYQSEHRSFEFDKWAYIGRIVIEELEKRIDDCFRVA